MTILICFCIGYFINKYLRLIPNQHSHHVRYYILWSLSDAAKGESTECRFSISLRLKLLTHPNLGRTSMCVKCHSTIDGFLAPPSNSIMTSIMLHTWLKYSIICSKMQIGSNFRFHKKEENYFYISSTNILSKASWMQSNVYFVDSSCVTSSL